MRRCCSLRRQTNRLVLLAPHTRDSRPVSTVPTFPCFQQPQSTLLHALRFPLVLVFLPLDSLELSPHLDRFWM